ncbi:RICIN domain-containing protein [Nonomuraea sp. SYSU D8015]|uniref:RICIN domain-containing protein n=1 Tax=Nonomuraea sp. SYSU D8015 TaxID=2593644 RepID=UPI0016613F9A|nr:RICIN domain-containing protein [Nonomuraea sp. SYSU D8015]
MRVPRTRKAAAVIMAVALIPAAHPVTAHASSSESGVRALAPACVGDGPFMYRNFKSGKVLSAQGGFGTTVVQDTEWGPHPFVPWQYWCRIPDGLYRSYENMQYNLNMGINGGSTAANASAILANPAGDINQDWLPRADSRYPAGVFALVNRKSSMCLGISNASVADGARAAQFPCDGNLNQGWSEVAVPGW